MTKEMKTVERDLSWMYFNHRILEEAEKPTVPVLERMAFLGIYSNNLDEFFRVRVATLRRMSLCKEKKARKEAAEAGRLLGKISRLGSRYAEEYQQAVKRVEQALEGEGIRIADERAIDERQRAYVEQWFQGRLAGRVMPVWTDRIRRFDNEADDAVYLIVRLAREGKKTASAIVPLPADVAGRWLVIPDDREGRHCVMYLDDVLRVCMPMVFAGIDCGETEAYSFKFTRDAEMEMDNDLTKGYMQKISKGVSSRKTGVPLRLVYDRTMPESLLRCIVKRLDGAGKLDTATAGGKYQNHRDMMRFPDFGRADLRYPAQPAARPLWLAGGGSVLDAVREADRMLHVPYQSFDGYLRLLGEAAIHPRGKAIKTTLYRLAHDSKVIAALICAAQNGKKVTVVIELLARFDESSNISWSKKMQDAGVEVVFGVEGLKVHSKITHISFTSGTAIACVSTGNFHEGNAAAYTDVLLMTARRNITAEVERVFRFIAKPYAPVKFRELLVSPNEMRLRFVALIDTEIRNHLAGRPAYIRAKLNHVTDPLLVSKIYEAAEAGVSVDLLVRGNCALTDNEALGGHLRVVGIIDRYLEHARIFCFAAGGEERVFIGSADWMPRNLDCRIEVVAPVYDEALKAECRRIVDYGLADTAQGHPVIGLPEDKYGDNFRSQTALYRHYCGETGEATQENNGQESE